MIEKLSKHWNKENDIAVYFFLIYNKEEIVKIIPLNPFLDKKVCNLLIAVHTSRN